jgi:hypothetical protein
MAQNVPPGFADRDERLNFVEHILDVLSESRTGRRRLFRFEIRSWAVSTPEFEIDLPDVVYNVTELLRMHAHQFFSIARSSNRRLDKFLMTSVENARTISKLFGRQSAVSHCSPLEFRGLLPLPRGSPLIVNSDKFKRRGKSLSTCHLSLSTVENRSDSLMIASVISE